MKVLVDNYVSNLSTEALYFNECINRGGGESRIWDRAKLSVFDQFDSYKPDVFVCHFARVDADIIKYLSLNKSTSLVMNITGATQETIDNINQQLHGTVNCSLLFTNTPASIIPIAERSIKTINILPSVDVFQQPRNAVLFSIGTAVVSSQPIDTLKDLTKTLDTYHLLNLASRTSEGYDAQVDIPTLVDVYDKYEKFVLFDSAEMVVSQVFFETIYRAKQVVIEVGKADRPKYEKFLESLFHVEEGDIGSVIKSQIRQKHTCFNRTSRLVKHLGDEELSQNILKVGGVA